MSHIARSRFCGAQHNFPISCLRTAHPPAVHPQIFTMSDRKAPSITLPLTSEDGCHSQRVLSDPLSLTLPHPKISHRSKCGRETCATEAPTRGKCSQLLLIGARPDLPGDHQAPGPPPTATIQFKPARHRTHRRLNDARQSCALARRPRASGGVHTFRRVRWLPSRGCLAGAGHLRVSALAAAKGNVRARQICSGCRYGTGNCVLLRIEFPDVPLPLRTACSTYFRGDLIDGRRARPGPPRGAARQVGDQAPRHFSRNKASGNLSSCHLALLIMASILGEALAHRPAPNATRRRRCACEP